MTECYTYYQASGQFFAPSGELMALCYSGHGEGLNNPAMEAVHQEAVGVYGPIPAGMWSIGLTPLAHTSCGPYALPLEPVGHNAYGRDLFRIHGDNPALSHSASHGCIIMARPARIRITRGTCAALLVKAR